VSAATEHSPRDWFAPGRWPSCSCGVDPRDNAKLTAHWAESGVRWVDEGGRLVSYPVAPLAVRERLEYLRGEIRAERISYGEIAELQGLAEHIEPGDVELLQWAGVPE
jgi:hypothetical protein